MAQIETTTPAPLNDEGLSVSLASLLSVCGSLNQDRPLELMLDDLLRELRGMVRADAGAVYLVDAERLRFVCTQSDSRPDLIQCPRKTGSLVHGMLKGVTLPLDGSSLAAFVARGAACMSIPDVYDIPESAPYAFDRSLDEKTGYRTRSMLVLPIGIDGQKPLGVIQAINYKGDPGFTRAPSDAPPFPHAAHRLASALASMATIVVRNAQLRQQVERGHLETIFRLATAAEFRDNDTGAHIQRVSMYCETIALALGLPQSHCQHLLFAAPMHDVGKLGVPDAILTKAGPLTPEERETMKQHTLMGARILKGSDNDIIRCAETIALTHHEKWDGTGYPHGLKAEAIPVEGRICAVADVFDALTSARSYKSAFPLAKAYDIIKKDSGTHFDPAVADAFIRSRDVVESIHEAYAAVQAEQSK